MDKLAYVIAKRGFKEFYSKDEVLEMVVEAYNIARSEASDKAAEMLKDLNKLEKSIKRSNELLRSL